jgi:hypothetical protein
LLLQDQYLSLDDLLGSLRSTVKLPLVVILHGWELVTVVSCDVISSHGRIDLLL